MTGNKSIFDEMVQGHRNAVANAVRDSHARGVPVFEADDHHVFAVYPDGRRVAIERVGSPLPSRDPQAN
ncbi:MAG: hypothetical protein KF889_08410 [Alphaproteobacteria bacterium]|nr:hypothetical protein [Alphaproteobacteria bacterium]MCW5740842.1 hypothetical protein [Alphaproteobacteria bacterium]